MDLPILIYDFLDEHGWELYEEHPVSTRSDCWICYIDFLKGQELLRIYFPGSAMLQTKLRVIPLNFTPGPWTRGRKTRQYGHEGYLDLYHPNALLLLLRWRDYTARK